MKSSLFLSKTSKLAQVLTRRLNVPVTLINGTSCTDGEKLMLDMRQGEYEGELKQFYDGVSDHETAHMMFTQFVNPRAKQKLTNQRAINIFEDIKYNSSVQHLEDMRVNKLFGDIYPGGKENITSMEETALMFHDQNFDKNNKMFKYSFKQRCLLFLRSRPYSFYINKYFKNDYFVINDFRKLWINKFEKRYTAISNTTDLIFFAKELTDEIEKLEQSIKEEFEKKKEEKKKEEKKKEEKKKDESNEYESDEDESNESEDDDESDEESNSSSKSNEESNDESNEEESEDESHEESNSSSKSNEEESEDESDEESNSSSESNEESNSSSKSNEESNNEFDEESNNEFDEESNDDEQEDNDSSGFGSTKESDNEPKLELDKSELKDLDKTIKDEMYNMQKNIDRKELRSNIYDCIKEVSDKDLVIDLKNSKQISKCRINFRGTKHYNDLVNKQYSSIRKQYLDFLQIIRNDKDNNRMLRVFQEFLFSRSETFEYEHESEGSYNINELLRQSCMDEYKSHFPFINKTLSNDKSIAISLLVDMSGSMNGESIIQARKIIIQLAETFKKLGIKFEVNGFNSTERYNSFTRVEFGRTESLDYFIFKNFEDNDNSLLFLIPEFISGSNADGAAMEIAAERLSQRNEDRKILFYLCDGQPTGYIITEAGEKHMQFIAEQAIKNSMEFYSIGIGIKTAKIFGEKISFYIQNNKSISENLGRLITNKI